jgi:hypothetical protein
MHSDPEQNALRDILRQIDLAQNFAQGQDRDAFSADITRVYAVTRCLEIISEASRRLSRGSRHDTPVLLGGRRPAPETSTATIIRMWRPRYCAPRSNRSSGFELSATRACPRSRPVEPDAEHAPERADLQRPL